MAKPRVNKLTSGYNLLWESSRMMLPEHKERINGHRESLNRKERPVLDEQEMEELALRIGESLETGRPVTLKLYGEYADREVTGVVTKVDPQAGRIRLRTALGDMWAKMRDVIGAE
ncbi:MAG: YolD-like family protein [Thermobacillus sp.]|jgi:hypothetical protein|uniref:Uncharacterized protein / YolD-like protein n=1 Tax=Thermobacillus xylanilyticus TaxID=76633 RepID=A0ABN7RJJ7_THEXY|nr:MULTISPECIES: YolD-like family protein [Thermobacillus]REJ16603.1 MAG: YolD-like family protein [Paenibacillaceae bacterium]REK53930.1 MAG: YolD-like family protein [Thermobacillus sp.]CAG5078396.1 Uncharacterized protein / YolD-like protein [Thermobacillus xylanilyticus]